MKQHPASASVRYLSCCSSLGLTAYIYIYRTSFYGVKRNQLKHFTIGFHHPTFHSSPKKPSQILKSRWAFPIFPWQNPPFLLHLRQRCGLRGLRGRLERLGRRRPRTTRSGGFTSNKWRFLGLLWKLIGFHGILWDSMGFNGIFNRN